MIEMAVFYMCQQEKNQTFHRICTDKTKRIGIIGCAELMKLERCAYKNAGFVDFITRRENARSNFRHDEEIPLKNQKFDGWLNLKNSDLLEQKNPDKFQFFG